MRRVATHSLLALFLLTVAACPGTQSTPDGGTPFVCEPVGAITCPTPAPSYSTDVAPVLRARCVICHNGTPEGPWPLQTYTDVADWYDTVRDDVNDCSMPPSDAGILSVEEKQVILRWIACGLPR